GTIGSGPGFIRTDCVAVDSDEHRAFVFDRGAGAMYAIDLATGNRTVVSDSITGTGPALTEVADMVLDGAGKRLLAVDAGRLAVVDLDTGNRSHIRVTLPDRRPVPEFGSVTLGDLPGHVLAVSGDL